MPGRPDVEDDRLEPGVRLEQVHGLEAVRRQVHDVVIRGQHAGEQTAEARIVFDDEEVHGTGSSRSS